MTDKQTAKRTTTPIRRHAQTAKPAAASAADPQTLQAALDNPAAASPAQLLTLQSTLGNRAVGAAIQRAAQVGAEGGAVDARTQGAIESARGGGAALDRRVGTHLGQALGADFSAVKVHTDAASDSLNRSLSAQAFTLGSDIFFSQGAYQPQTSGGQKLLAHELTHVVQQSPVAGGSRWNKVQPKLTVGAAGDRYEQEADRVASSINFSAPARVDEAAAPATGRPGAARQIARQITKAPSGVKASTSPAVIRRKIGYEFEGNFKTHLFLPDKNKNQAISDDQKEGRHKSAPPNEALKPIAKGTALATGSRFEVQADELPSGKSDLEFVTTLPPFDESPKERDSLKQTLSHIKSIGDKLAGSTNRFIEASELPNVTADIPTALIEQPMTKMLLGSPQATIAIRLDRVNKFMSDTGAPGKDTNFTHTAGREDLMGMGKKKGEQYSKDAEIASRAAARARKAIEVYSKTINAQKKPKDVAVQIGSEELIGLVTLLTTYIIRGDEETLSYAKNITILLARTDFATMFKQLPGPEQKHFKSSGGEPFAQLVLSAAGLAGTEDEKVIKHGLNYKAESKNVLDDLTRGRWLKNITKGKDMLTAKNIGGNKARKKEMESLGALGKRTEKVGQGKDAPIFELRRIKQSVPYTQWPALALDIFDYAVKLNTGGSATYERNAEETRQQDEQNQQNEEYEDYMQQRRGGDDF